MTERSYREDPLTPGEREEFETDLISLCDRELDLLGDLRGIDVLYAGGSSPLWIEGLSQRVGEDGSVTALDLDEERVEAAREGLEEADLASPTRLVAGDVFGMPFPSGTFDLVYSAGLFHELDVGQRTAREALAALCSVTRSGGRVATSDFVDSQPAVQIEDERLQADLAREVSGGEPYGIGPAERLVGLHQAVLAGVRWRLSPPLPVRHLDKLVVAEGEPEELSSLPSGLAEVFRERLYTLRERIRREGYSRPATLYVEGVRGD
ncbi:MAG: class I SAM-dependent methyltransferase [Actinomycetota bacterium]|nr:class I SAM-dependent methyltransferase [Actinomycetota bacterium]